MSILGVREFIKWSKPQNTPKPHCRLEMKTASYTEPCKCHTCVRTASYMWRTLSYLRRNFFFAGATFLCWCDFSFLVRLSLAGATFFLWRDCFFCWRDFLLLARLFCWRDFFSLARLFSLALICRSLLVLSRAQTTSTCSCKQDGWLRSRESK